MKQLLCVVIGLLLTGPAAAVLASDSAGQQTAGEAPPMGPPPEIKELATLVGTWDVKGRSRMEPGAEWTEYTGISSCEYVCGGAALLMEFTEPMMGTTYEGLGLLTYDRENGEWQVTWTDNMGARTALYTGTQEDGKIVMTGMDKFAGQSFLTRMTTYDITEPSYKWQMENSMDDGKTWYISMEAVYTRQ